MATEKSEAELEEEVRRGIRDSMQKRNIVNMKAHLEFLRDQKIKKKNASLARAKEADREITVISKMLEENDA